MCYVGMGTKYNTGAACQKQLPLPGSLQDACQGTAASWPAEESVAVRQSTGAYGSSCRCSLFFIILCDLFR